MGLLKVYTAETIEHKYPNSMANAVHFMYSEDGSSFEVLNQGYGILYKKANVLENNTLEELGIKEPLLTQQDGVFIILAKIVDRFGKWVEQTQRVLWKTRDFVHFDEQVIHPVEEIEDLLKNATDTLGISDTVWEKMKHRWLPLEAVSAYPESKVTSLKQLEKVRATVTYSDGTKSLKRVLWDVENGIQNKEGKLEITGRVLDDTTGFPLAVGYADPVVFAWEGKWYFLATNDNVDDVGIFVREADHVSDLFSSEMKESCILDYDEEKGFCQTFWAPEFHVIGGELYILFAVSGKQWGPQCHIMHLKKGGHIVNAADWEEPIRICKQNGAPLVEEGISLDMTYFKVSDRSYVCWSERYQIGTELDSGSMLYIATVDEKIPWKLTSEPVLLSRPLYGWENNSGTINNEGPYPMVLGDQIYMAFSGGDACGYYYAIGYLMAKSETDLLNPENWEKTSCPVFHSGSVEGIQGPGHNSFFYDEEGRLMIAYHGQERDMYFKRCTAMHPVHVSADGFPLLNVIGGMDKLPPLKVEL